MTLMQRAKHRAKEHATRRTTRFLPAGAVVLAVVLGTLLLQQGATANQQQALLAAAPVELVLPVAPVELGQWCQDRRAQGTNGLSTRARNWLNDCVAVFGVNPTASPSSSAPSSPTASPTTPAPTQPPVTTPPPSTPSPTATATKSPSPTATATTTPPGPAPRTIRAYITGYSWFDNTPPGSAAIATPVLHRTAGGVGTYADPTTIAVGHSITGSRDVLDWAAGTRFYIPNLRRYFIVEDACGDGSNPQGGPCHTGYPAGASTWLDLWVGGQGGSNAAADRCMGAITKVSTVVVDPPAGYPVVAGDVYSSAGCTQQYGDQVPAA